jgi:hypothetical protein
MLTGMLAACPIVAHRASQDRRHRRQSKHESAAIREAVSHTQWGGPPIGLADRCARSSVLYKSRRMRVRPARCPLMTCSRAEAPAGFRRIEAPRSGN